MRPESVGHRRAPADSAAIPLNPNGPARRCCGPRASSCPACSEPHQSGTSGRVLQIGRGGTCENWGCRSQTEKHAWMVESLISSWEDAALWCEIVWSCHLSQASLKATLKPVMGLTSLSYHSFMSLFIFCFVTPPPRLFCSSKAHPSVCVTPTATDPVLLPPEISPFFVRPLETF